MSKLICINPGHGGYDDGASYHGVDEDDINLAIAFYLDYELHLNGYRTLLTRNKDEYFSLYQVALTANMAKADLFISIHCDAFTDPEAQGMTVHTFTTHSLMSAVIAESIDSQLVKRFPKMRHRDIRKSDIYVLGNTRMPAVLIECGFLSNNIERGFLKEAENQRELAQAIKQGITLSI